MALLFVCLSGQFIALCTLLEFISLSAFNCLSEGIVHTLLKNMFSILAGSKKD